MRVITASPSEPRDERLAEAIRVLRSGGSVALPTETFYGLAVDPFDEDAVRGVNRLKGKPEDSSCLLLLADAAQAQCVAGRLPERFGELAKLFWPGPLTLVVPASPELPRTTTGGRDTVALRVPGLPLSRRVAALFGAPVTGVSANRHGEPACRRAIEVARTFGEGVDLILDGGPTTGGAPSTIVDLCGARPRLLRRGVLPVSSLRTFLPDLQQVP